MPPLIMKPAMPVSPIPTFPRKRGKGQTNRYASFTSNRLIRKARILADLGGVRRVVMGASKNSEFAQMQGKKVR